MDTKKKAKEPSKKAQKVRLLWDVAGRKKLYKLRVDKTLIELTSSMLLHPDLQDFEAICTQAEATAATRSQSSRFLGRGSITNFRISIYTVDEDTIDIVFDDLQTFRKWHALLCKAFEEITITEACALGPDGRLSAFGIERAIKKCELYVPITNHYMARAIRLLNRKNHVSNLLRLLRDDPHAESMEKVMYIVAECSRDRILATDAELRVLRQLVKTIFDTSDREIADDMSTSEMSVDMSITGYSVASVNTSFSELSRSDSVISSTSNGSFISTSSELNRSWYARDATNVQLQRSILKDTDGTDGVKLRSKSPGVRFSPFNMVASVDCMDYEKSVQALPTIPDANEASSTENSPAPKAAGMPGDDSADGSADGSADDSNAALAELECSEPVVGTQAGDEDQMSSMTTCRTPRDDTEDVTEGRNPSPQPSPNAKSPSQISSAHDTTMQTFEEVAPNMPKHGPKHFEEADETEKIEMTEKVSESQTRRKGLASSWSSSRSNSRSRSPFARMSNASATASATASAAAGSKVVLGKENESPNVFTRKFGSMKAGVGSPTRFKKPAGISHAEDSGTRPRVAGKHVRSSSRIRAPRASPTRQVTKLSPRPSPKPSPKLSPARDARRNMPSKCVKAACGGAGGAASDEIPAETEAVACSPAMAAALHAKKATSAKARDTKGAKDMSGRAMLMANVTQTKVPRRRMLTSSSSTVVFIAPASVVPPASEVNQSV
jgi:hypothetical protein